MILIFYFLLFLYLMFLVFLLLFHLQFLFFVDVPIFLLIFLAFLFLLLLFLILIFLILLVLVFLFLFGLAFLYMLKKMATLFFIDIVYLELFKPASRVLVDFLRFCYIGLLRKVLKEMTEEWNGHRITKSFNGHLLLDNVFLA